MKNRIVTIGIFLFSLLLCGGLSKSLFAQGKNIVIVHSYSLNIVEWVEGQEKGFKAIVGSGYKYHTFYMSTKRIPPETFAEKALEALTFVEEKQADLVYVTDDNATKLVGRFVSRDIPVVFSGVNAHIRKDYPWALYPHRNITGVLERPLIKRTILEMNDAVSANIGKVLIILGTSPTGMGFFNNDLGGEVDFKLRADKVHVKRSGKVEDWKTWVLESKREGYTAILPTAIFALIDANGNKVDGYDVARWISKNSPIPVYTIHMQVIGKDMFIGGMILSGRLMGEDAGKLANEILVGGKSPHSVMPLIQTQGVLLFSKTQLKKWNLTVNSKYTKKVKLLD